MWKHYSFLLFLILELISFAFIINGNKHHSAVFATVANHYGGAIFGSYTNLRNYLHLKDANELLSQENASLRNQLNVLRFQTDSINFQAFSPIDTSGVASLDSSRIHFDFIAAKVISNSTNRQKNYIMLNKGKKHGVHENMGLIGPSGLIGIVFETSEEFSTAISLLNIKLNISAKIKKNNELGTVIWDGISPQFGKLEAIENYLPLSKGDSVVTSGFSHVFPEGELIGTIEEFELIPGKTSWNIRLKYSSDFSRLYWVNICRNLNYEEQIKLKSLETEN